MSELIHRTRTTGPDILVYDEGDDLALVCGSVENWFSVSSQDPAGSVFSAVDRMAQRMNVEVVEFSAPLAG